MFVCFLRAKFSHEYIHVIWNLSKLLRQLQIVTYLCTDFSSLPHALPKHIVCLTCRMWNQIKCLISALVERVEPVPSELTASWIWKSLNPLCGWVVTKDFPHFYQKSSSKPKYLDPDLDREYLQGQIWQPQGVPSRPISSCKTIFRCKTTTFLLMCKFCITSSLLLLFFSLSAANQSL